VTFYDYMQNFVGDQTPLGELAHYLNKDCQFPKHEKTTDNILSYFIDEIELDDEHLETVKRSLSLYEQQTVHFSLVDHIKTEPKENVNED